MKFALVTVENDRLRELGLNIAHESNLFCTKEVPSGKNLLFISLDFSSERVVARGEAKKLGAI